ncbi:hypothetical protein HHI36_007118 [Cryptolaemus montrouzieri]|uniref:Uncharacterized protein n=1 Tax=Cryptolaemus montrouzieri TaxID=559131 RepID=A0ABD2MNU9_9CUCU
MAPPIIIQDFTKICRCCMEVASYDIFKTYFENEPLSKLLLTCTNLRVPRNDTLPKNICQSCLQQLISAYIFNQKVCKTQTAICEIAKVLDKAKFKKNVNISSDHDYHNAKRNKGLKQNLEMMERTEEQDAAENITPIKVEMDSNEDEYLEEHTQHMQVDGTEVKYIKQQGGDEEQEYWLEEAAEGEGEAADGEGQPIEGYDEMNNIFETVKVINPLAQFQEANYIEEEGQEEDREEYETLEQYENGETEEQQVVMRRPKKKVHICQVCSEAFATARQLQVHSEEVNHPQKFCTTCYEFFHSYSALIKHCMDTKHPRPQMFKCPYCFKKCDNKKTLVAHVRCHVKSRNVKVVKDKEGNLGCQICKTAYANMYDLRQHYKENVESHLTCSICLRRFSALTKLKNHLKAHSNEKPHECQICGLRFNLENNLERHLKIHAQDVKAYRCQYCPKVFTRRLMLEQHEKLHGTTNYLCTECGKVFTSGGFLKKHVERYHLGLANQKNQRGPHECELCGKVLSCKATLYSHMRNVHEKTQKLFPCVICGKVLKTKTSLELHVNYHTGNCPFKCDICGKAFTNATTLKSHSLIHTDERPYSCHICHKTFKQKPHLNTHILTIHTGIKPFACSYCDKTFALNGNLSQHLKTHTGCKSPFVCSVCNKAFYFASRLRKHEKIHMK